MKKIFTAIFTFCTLLLLSGCIQIETKVNLNKDGSGTVEETVLMSNEMVNMLNEFISGFSSDTTQPEEFKLYNEEDLKKRESSLGEGVTLLSSSEIKTDTKQGYKVEYSFTDINKLRIDQNPDSRIPDDGSEVEPADTSYVTFNFTRGDVSQLTIDLPDPVKYENEEEFETEEDTTDTGDLSELKFLIQDLSFKLVVHVNGELTESNADYVEDSDITLFNLNFNQLLDNPEKLKELNKMKSNDLKELKEIMKDIPGIKIETNDPVVIKFR